jgi:signal peptidase
MKEEERTTESTTTSRARSAGRYVVGGGALLLLLALVAPFVVYGFPEVIGADASFVVLSGSMEPDIKTGDAVIVDGVRPGQVAVGDVITFTRDGASAPITHRVIEVTGDGPTREFVTKGDNNEEADARTVPAANVVGRVVLTIPYIGFVIEFANTEPGYLLFVVVPIGLLILNEAYTFLRKPARTDDADEPDGAPTAATADADADEGEAPVFQFTRADLTFTMIALGGLTAYAAYVAVVLDTSAITVAILVAAAGVLALAAAIRYGAPSPEEALAVADGGVALTSENRIVSGTKPDALDDRTTVTVESLTDLVAMARADDAWIVHDTDRLYFVTDGTVFVHPVETDDTAADAEDGDDTTDDHETTDSDDAADGSEADTDDEWDDWAAPSEDAAADDDGDEEADR